MRARSHVRDGRQVTPKTDPVGSSGAAGLALTALVLTVMAGCARVSTEYVQKSTDRLPKPELILVHDYQVSEGEVQLDSAISSRIKRTVEKPVDCGEAPHWAPAMPSRPAAGRSPAN